MSDPRPLRAPGRDRCLERLVDQLGAGELGRTFGLRRISGLPDLRAQVPLLDARAHAARVDPLLDLDGPADAGAAAERAEVVMVWRTWLSEHVQSGMSEETALRAGLLQARRADPAVDAIAEDDLAALGAEVLRLHTLDDPAHALERLAAFEPGLLVSPSAAAFACLEEQVRGPLERRLPRLRLLLASFDVRLRLRARRAALGRVDRPARRPARPAVAAPAGPRLHPRARQRDRRAAAPGDDRRGSDEAAALWPEHAIVGERYELVVSSGTGCLRLRTGEFVRVVGFDPPTALVPFPAPAWSVCPRPTRRCRSPACRCRAPSWPRACARRSARRTRPWWRRRSAPTHRAWPTRRRPPTRARTTSSTRSSARPMCRGSASPCARPACTCRSRSRASRGPTSAPASAARSTTT
ncbi:hypothetical protein [Nannocystis pusilla]|uniref:hypothetical protein n=1 Tax=Nannocystis pusilla TaxID=889268 RepID=UPI003B7B2726